ncbi:hypothetical protein D3C71_685950 [compost metagenome]
MRVDGVRGHRIVDRVGLGECRGTHRAVGTAVHLAGIAGAAAQGQAEREGVAGPAGEGIARRVGQVAGAVGGNVGAFLHVGIQVAVAGAHRPVVGDAAHRGHLDALHRLLAGLGGVAGVIEHLGVDLVADLGLEQRHVQGQCVAQEAPLGAHLERLCLLRIQAGIVGAAGRGAQLEIAATGRLLGDGVVGIQADQVIDLVHRADFPVEQGVRLRQRRIADHRADRIAAAGWAAPTADRRALVLGLVVVCTHAGGEQETLADVERVEEVRRRRRGLAMAVGAVVGPGQAGGVPVRCVQVGRRPHAAAGGGLPETLQFFAGELQAGAQVVLDRTGGEVDAQVELIGKDGVLLVLEGRQAAREGVAAQVGGGGVADVAGRRAIGAAGAGAHEGGQHVVLVGAAPACGVGQADVVVDVVLDAERGHLRGDVVVVGTGTVEVLRIHRVAGELLQRGLRRPARQAEGRHAAVGHVVLFHVKQVEVVARGGAQAEGKRRGDAPAAVVDVVAAGLVVVLPHGIEPQRAGSTQGLVPVGGGARLAVGTGRDGAGHRVMQGGLLAHHVDRAGGGRAAVVGTGRSLGHFHLFGIEHIARDRADVAHAIHEDAAGRVEAAHENAVTGVGVAVLAHIERSHARAVAQCIGQRGGTLLVEQVGGDHLDGLRRVLQRLGELGRGDLVGLVAAYPEHVYLVQGLWRGIAGLGKGCHGQRGQAQAGDQPGGGQAGGAARRGRVLAALDHGGRSRRAKVGQQGHATIWRADRRCRQGRGNRQGHRLRHAQPGQGHHAARGSRSGVGRGVPGIEPQRRFHPLPAKRIGRP